MIKKIKIVMGSSYTNINAHIVFHIKSSTMCLMKEEDLPRIFQYIGGVINKLSGYPYAVGGRPDHIHAFTTIPATTSLSDFVRAIKANSSKWIKSLDDSYRTFGWQEGYGAFSVSNSKRQAVIHYINNQREHHRNRTANEEFQQFLIDSGLLYAKDEE